LIEGQLIRKSGQSSPHAGTVRRVNIWLLRTFGLSAVRCQLLIEVASEDQERNEPEPDVAVTTDPEFDHFTRHPRGDESTLLVEIADASSPLDHTVKRALYARALVPEYWVVDLRARALFVHRHPASGHYRQVIRLSEDETVAPDSRPDAVVKVSELLPHTPPAA
jgi:Uma2 family endonuclease